MLVVGKKGTGFIGLLFLCDAMFLSHWCEMSANISKIWYRKNRDQEIAPTEDMVKNYLADQRHDYRILSLCIGNIPFNEIAGFDATRAAPI